MDTRSLVDKAIKARVERGMNLYLDGAVAAHGDAFVVAGTARNYTVFFIDGEPCCDCPDYRERARDAGHSCKHGYSVVLFEAEGCRAKPGPKITRH